MTERSCMDSGKATDRDALLVEYQAAQDSAQHHDNLLYTVTSLMWGASLLLLGFILEKLTDTTLRPLITALCVLGLVLNVTVWIFALQFNSVKRQKYARCKELEKQLNLSQHRNLRYASGSQRVLYAIVMLIFIFTWILVLWTMWKN
jgi:hypothetical protein